MEQLSTYTARTAKEKSMTPRMNQGAALPTACSAMPPASKAEEPRSLRTIAAARPKEMKVSMPEDATTSRTRSEIGACVVLGVAMGDYGRPGHLSACGTE